MDVSDTTDWLGLGEVVKAEAWQEVVAVQAVLHRITTWIHAADPDDDAGLQAELAKLDPFSFGDSLLGVLAQRLVRRLCKACKRTVGVDEQTLRTEFGDDRVFDRLGLAGPFALGAAVGCEQCGEQGYKGRLGLHDYMDVTDAVRGITHRNGSVTELREAAIAGGMLTLRQDGLRKALAGHTDLAEIRRVCVSKRRRGAGDEVPLGQVERSLPAPSAPTKRIAGTSRATARKKKQTGDPPRSRAQTKKTKRRSKEKKKD